MRLQSTTLRLHADRTVVHEEATVQLQCTLLRLLAHRPVVHLVVLDFSMHAVEDGDVVALRRPLQQQGTGCSHPLSAGCGRQASSLPLLLGWHFSRPDPAAGFSSASGLQGAPGACEAQQTPYPGQGHKTSGWHNGRKSTLAEAEA